METVCAAAKRKALGEIPSRLFSAPERSRTAFLLHRNDILRIMPCGAAYFKMLQRCKNKEFPAEPPAAEPLAGSQDIGQFRRTFFKNTVPIRNFSLNTSPAALFSSDIRR